ncbi:MULTISPECIES: hypothetical protein [unclassified Flavobacterium]|uniref:hypothetical protein n=1 Tax=unclassified Flavobacterium TaxID=196869 RepID=UPI003F8ECC55
MTTNTMLLIVLSLLIAGGLSFFQYYYQAKNKSKLNLFLAFLRFLAVFGILLLLINPVISTNTIVITRPVLPVVVDNSSSITTLKGDKKALEVYNKLISNSQLQEKFDIQSYQVDSDFLVSDKFDFKGKQTNLDLVAKNLKDINRRLTFPTILITDGNQTTGNDFEYSFDASNKIFPIVLGDTTKVLDLKVNQINANKYAFYRNKFPVEVFLEYSGNKTLSANFTISQAKTILNSQQITFSPSKRNAVVKVVLPADQIGSQLYTVKINSEEKEQNTFNNEKNFVVEVMDQKSEVAIITTLNHPDIGALKRAIESNAQRKITVLNPNNISDLKKYTILILYQPNTLFKKVFDLNKQAGVNTFIITGTHTDFSFLNVQQDNLDFKMSGQNEDYTALFNKQFNLFATEDIDFENFPPLENKYGKVTTRANVSVLLSSKIRNMETNAPLLAFAENQRSRSAFLLGENLWKWRVQSHASTDSFEKFDLFINKTIQFLASSTTKKSLVVTHEQFYNSGEAIAFSAQYFNKNYEFDENARLTITVTNTKTKQTKNYDFLKSTNDYKVNLDGLAAGHYSFTVRELNSKTAYSNQFEILDFDIEKQFINPDVAKLLRVANQTSGTLFFPDQVDQLIDSLLKDESYKAVQKTNVSRSPLIEWYRLLVLIAVFLSAEWFIRKYNGLL